MVFRTQVESPQPAGEDQEPLDPARLPRTVRSDESSPMDPISRLLVLDRAKWKDRQQHGRLAYEMMMRHPDVRAAYGIVLNFLKSAEPSFSPAVQDPSDRQAEMSDFLDAQLDRVGWAAFVDGIVANELEFGFGLAEMGTTYANYRGRQMVQVSRLETMPQGTLDAGHMPREELGEVNSVFRPRYTCFDMDPTATRITAVWQNRQYEGSQAPLAASGRLVRKWEGEDLRYILHFKHGGQDGNPFGESLLYSAFYPWSDLYMLERKEQQFLETNSDPTRGISYDSDVSSPEANVRIEEVLTNPDMQNILVGNRLSPFVLSAASEQHRQHLGQAMDYRSRQIYSAILVPRGIAQESREKEQNVRDVIQMFVKFRLPALFKEIGEQVKWQFGKRLIDSNYRNVEVSDYPDFKLSIHIDNDLRTAMPLLQQAIRYVDADRLGETLESLIPGFKREWVPESHAQSTEMKRPMRDANDEPNTVVDSKNKPPDTTGDRGDRPKGDGKSRTVGRDTNTAA